MSLLFILLTFERMLQIFSEKQTLTVHSSIALPIKQAIYGATDDYRALHIKSIFKFKTNIKKTRLIESNLVLLEQYFSKQNSNVFFLRVLRISQVQS